LPPDSEVRNSSAYLFRFSQFVDAAALPSGRVDGAVGHGLLAWASARVADP